MLQNAGALYILTRKCAWRHSGVQFFRIETSKIGPSLRCLAHFDWQMCLAPQRRAIFGHLTFKNCSAIVVLCAFWLGNVLRATAACHFSSELPKLLRPRGVLCILTLTWKCASCHSGVPFFICLLNSYLRTRQLARLLFEHQEPRIIEKTQRFATSLTFGARVACF